MLRIAGVFGLTSTLLVATAGASLAQGWPSWANEAFGRTYGNAPAMERPEPQVRPRQPSSSEDERSPLIRDGGARPVIVPVVAPIVAFGYDFPANSIVIDTGARKLYYVLTDKRAHVYSIGVGREGFGWTGTETISRKQAWPDWHPPAEMRERDPRLPEKMTGGVRNPLGAMALYLGNTLYRIHGTSDPKSIGKAESSGCFRMLNSSVMHLASLTEIGTPVAVVNALPSGPNVSSQVDAKAKSLATQSPSPVPEGKNDKTLSASPASDYRSLRNYTLQAQ